MAEPLYLSALNDYIFKQLFYTERNKSLLINFLNALFEEYGGETVKDLTYLSPILLPDKPLTKEGVVDVLCELQSGRKITIEMQNYSKVGYLKRILFYGSKIYSSFLPKGGHYTSLDDVVSISVCNFVMFPNKTDFVSYHKLTDVKTGESDINGITYIFVELPKLKKLEFFEDSKDVSLFQRWCYFLLHSVDIEPEDIDLVCNGNRAISDAFVVVDCANWSKEDFKEYALAYKKDKTFEDQEWEYKFNHAKKCMDSGLTLDEVKRIFELDEEHVMQLINLRTRGRVVVSIDTNS